MSTGGLKNRGRPDAMVESSHFIFRYCGGMGGGNCPVPEAGTFTTFTIKVPRFITYNRRIVFNNPAFLGLRFWNDAGASFPCDHSIGVTEYPFWLAFSDAGDAAIITAEEIERKGIECSGELPYSIDVPDTLLPQPVLPGGGPNPDWDSKIYVHVLWKVSGLVNEGGDIGPNSLLVAKHDYDIKL